MQEQPARRPKRGTDIDPLPARGDMVAEVEPGAISQMPTDADLLIVIERRDFIRGCLTCWLGNLCAEFATMPVADVETSLEAGALRQAAAALVGVDAPEHAEAWLMRQVGWLRAKSPNLPIIMIVEADEQGRGGMANVEVMAAILTPAGMCWRRCVDGGGVTFQP